MTRARWIICERTSRWAAALREALASRGKSPRICETRRLSEIDAELQSHPLAVVAIEVHPHHFAELLDWLTDARRRHPQVRCAALVDRSVLEIGEQVIGILLEAGIDVYAISPRKLDAVIALGERHREIAEKTPHDGSFVDRVWASLPWQAAPSPVGWEVHHGGHREQRG